MTASPQTLGQLIQNGAVQYGADPALICPGRTLSYAELHELCVRMASTLRAGGIMPGDRVAIALPNDWQFVVAVFAVVLAEAVVVPLDPAIRPGNFLNLARDCELSGLIIDGAAVTRLAPAVNDWHQWCLVLVNGDAAPAQGELKGCVSSFASALGRDSKGLPDTGTIADPETNVSISYTSGTTGKPKGVMHSHRSWLHSAAFTGDYFRLSEGDKILVPLPLHHAYSFRHILAYLLKGGVIVVAQDIFEGLKITRVERPQALLLVPAAAKILLRFFKEILSECGTFLNFISIGTAHMPPHQLNELQALLPQTEIHIPYGLTEARVGFLCPQDGGATKRLSVLSPGLEIRVIDQEGNPVPPGQSGEIVVKGEGLMAGYWPGTEAEARRLQDWGFATGDLGRVESTGDVSLLGRVDDIVNIGGRKVAPTEVETVLTRHPGVLEAAVIGIPDPNGLTGSQLKGFVVIQDGREITDNELIDYCKERLELYKVPVAFDFRSSLPKSAVGKILKNRLA